MNYLRPQKQFCNQKNFTSRSIQTAIRAELIGSDCCCALGITERSTTPVLTLCRRLVEAGHDPATPLEGWRGSTLCLRIRRIGEAARSYVLIFTIVLGSGSVKTLRVPDFDSYGSCAEYAIGWASAQQQLYPDATIRWDCQPQQ
jgi:hypothetical protein